MSTATTTTTSMMALAKCRALCFPSRKYIYLTSTMCFVCFVCVCVYCGTVQTAKHLHELYGISVMYDVDNWIHAAVVKLAHLSIVYLCNVHFSCIYFFLMQSKVFYKCLSRPSFIQRLHNVYVGRYDFSAVMLARLFVVCVEAAPMFVQQQQQQQPAATCIVLVPIHCTRATNYYYFWLLVPCSSIQFRCFLFAFISFNVFLFHRRSSWKMVGVKAFRWRGKYGRRAFCARLFFFGCSFLHVFCCNLRSTWKFKSAFMFASFFFLLGIRATIVLSVRRVLCLVSSGCSVVR